MVPHRHSEDENTKTHRRKTTPLKLGSGWQLDENPGILTSGGSVTLKTELD